MRILVVGAGATGGFYGGLLSRSGRDVTFLLRERRAQQIRDRGLEVVLHTGEQLTLHPSLLTVADLRSTQPRFDLILISTKSYQLEGAIDDIAPAVQPDTMLLPVLNGMHQITMLSERFASDQVLGGSVRIMSFLDDNNRIIQMNALDQMSYGELSGERTSRILDLHAAMQGCGFMATLQPDIMATLWQKWVVLASLGSLCVLAGGNVGQAASVPHGTELATALIAECTAIATANGYPPPANLLTEHTARMTSPSAATSTSLYRDMVDGAPVEADHIIGDLIGHSKGLPAPLLTAAYVRLKVYERQRLT